jgi:hypothetical protein
MTLHMQQNIGKGTEVDQNSNIDHPFMWYEAKYIFKTVG